MNEEKDLKILIVDDEKAFRNAIKYQLKESSIKIIEANSVDEAINLLKQNEDDLYLVLTDYKMPGKNGIDLLRVIKNLYPLIEVIIMTAGGSEDIAIQALRLGSMDYIKKPFKKDELLALIQKAKEIHLLKKQNTNYYNEIMNIKDMTDSEIESYRLFSIGIIEELAEKRMLIDSMQNFLNQLDKSELSLNIRKQLDKLMEKYNSVVEVI